jgi:regulator of protease activity HflC (stomatin/prohibitin superfamily)
VDTSAWRFVRIVVVEQGTAMVVERLGKFHRR